ncbi:DUF1376 domain-containing protein [Novacetimonas hansenii]|uniref:DUF1376 domain-containing protein n=1 Tax=Novacetimonas hansenii TaxID=436 RepID=UPI00177BA963|nr:DUF1376 domain-containing protein [Novacetimonas hansenii]QOF95646.1 DUF1376 domain-containing protein [Novacetimonas hansenii]
MNAPPDMTAPAPLSPPDCDLRGYEFMPLFGHRLFCGPLYTQCTDAEFRAALRLWWSAWNQVPAGSLPMEDRALATLADFGRDVRAWRRVRARALDGFVACSDGRLYHPLLAREATRAHVGRVRAQRRRNDDAERLRRWRGTRSDPPDTHPDPTPAKRVSSGVDRNSKSESKNEPPAAPYAARPPVPGAATADMMPPDATRTRNMAAMVAQAGDLTGRGPRQARALVGQWMKMAGDDAATLGGVLHDACVLRPADPVAWVVASLRQRTGDGPAHARDTRLAAWDAIPDLRGI